jgi:S1-C subfamily serine protease
VIARAPLAAAAIALAVAAVGCGRNDGGRTASTPTRTVDRTTRVEVIKRLDPKGHSAGTGAFDPARIYAREAPGVVTIVSVLDSGGGQLGGAQGAEGSGFVLNGRGEIATNAHVVTGGQGASIHKAQEVYVRFSDGNQVQARIVGFDPNADVALLRVDPGGLTLRPLPLGTSEHLAVGAPVVAIGSPFGQEQSLSVGVISATGRTIDSLTSFAIPGAIQTDAAINHGNSGGPLVDGQGAVLGINSQIKSESGDGTGVGFAVPIDAVRRSLDQLRATGHVEYAYLGVETALLYPQLARRLGLPVDHGAYVTKITPGGPAAEAGLRAGTRQIRFQGVPYPAGGDVIVRVGDSPVRTESDVAAALAPHAPGDRVRLQIARGAETRFVTVTLGRRPASAQG